MAEGGVTLSSSGKGRKDGDDDETLSREPAYRALQKGHGEGITLLFTKRGEAIWIS